MGNKDKFTSVLTDGWYALTINLTAMKLRDEIIKIKISIENEHLYKTCDLFVG